MINLVKINQTVFLGFLLQIFVYILMFFFLKKLLKAYLIRKEIKNYRTSLNILLIPFVVIDLSIRVILLTFFSDQIYYYLVVFGIKVGLGILLIYFIYNTNFIEISIYTIALLFLSLLFSIILVDFFEVFIVISIDLQGFLLYIIGFLLVLAAGFFLTYWGDKINLVDYKAEISLISILPGLIYFNTSFYLDIGSFSDNGLFIIMIALAISALTSFLAKKSFFARIDFKEIQELTILEKNINVLEIKNLKVHYPLLGGILKRQVGTVKAVDDVTFDIKSGKTVGLVGESGCGKTTIANAILNLVDKTDGDILFRGKKLPKYYGSDLRQKIQIVFQDPDASLNPRMKIFEIISEPLKNLLGITNKDKLRRVVLKLMEQVSLKREHMDRYPHEFSGGQKQRIVIARALACNPELIILDEPTSALDVSVQAQILNILRGLQKQYNFAFLFITHNLSVVHHIADNVAVMYLGKIVEFGSTEQVFNNPSHPYTIALLKSRSEIDYKEQNLEFVLEGEVPSPINPPSGCYFNPRCISDARTSECEYKIPHKIEIEDNHFIWCINPPKKYLELDELKFISK